MQNIWQMPKEYIYAPSTQEFGIFRIISKKLLQSCIILIDMLYYITNATSDV